MTRKRFIKEVSEDCGIDKETVAKVIESMEYKVLDIIALEDYVKFAFGKIFGFTKVPVRVCGSWQLKKDRKGCEHYWAPARFGYPGMEFSMYAKTCECEDAKTFFEKPENKMLTNARYFRKDIGMPELPEFNGKTEKEIVEICKKCDYAKMGDLSELQLIRVKAEERCNNFGREAAKRLHIQQDIQDQIDSGVAPEDIVVHTKQEIFQKDKSIWERIHETPYGEYNEELEKIRARDYGKQEY